jgi:hypothetical protein
LRSNLKPFRFGLRSALEKSGAQSKHKFIHGCGRLFGGNTFETNFRCAAGNKFNDVIIHALELSSVAAGLLTERVKMFQCFRRDGNAWSFGMNFIQCEPVAIQMTNCKSWHWQMITRLE